MIGAPCCGWPRDGPRAGYEGAKRQRGAQGHTAIEAWGHLLAVHGTAAQAQDRPHVTELAQQGQQVTGDAVEIAYGDQGYTGQQAAQKAAAYPSHLAGGTLPEAQNGAVLWPTRWVRERRNAWAARWRHLAPDDAQLVETLAGLHFVACASLMRKRVVELIV